MAFPNPCEGNYVTGGRVPNGSLVPILSHFSLHSLLPSVRHSGILPCLRMRGDVTSALHRQAIRDMG
jgi:hypothetical protein